MPLVLRRYLRILFCRADKGGVGHYRVTLPVKYLRNTGFFCTDSMAISASLVESHDVLYFSRQYKWEIISFLQKFSAGLPIIHDFDDYLFHVDPANPASALFYRPEVQKGLIEFTKMSKVVTVSTEPLMEEMKKRFPKKLIVLCPNGIEDDNWLNPEAKKPNDKIRIGWAGSVSHVGDMRIIADAVNEIARKYQNKVEFHFFGVTEEWLSNVGIKTDAPNIHTHKPVPVEMYMAMLKNLNFDIGFAPLDLTRFNDCKSNIKFLEYTAAGVPGIYSPAYPYKSSIEHGVTGLLVKKNQIKHWIKAFEQLIHDEAMRKELVIKAQECVRKKWTMNQTVEYWSNAIEAAIQ